MTVSNRTAATKTVTWAAACCTVVGAFEGCDLTAKYDQIGTGKPLTWCHGETVGNVAPGQRFTKAQCDKMLEARLPQYWAEIEPCIHVETSDNEKVAYTSTSYNIGSAGFCRSAMVRKLNAGDHAGACNALMLYVNAQGRRVQGLVNRRAAERKVCLTPDNHPSAPAARTAVIPKPSEPAAPLAPKPAAKIKPRIFSWAWWTEK